LLLSATKGDKKKARKVPRWVREKDKAKKKDISPGAQASLRKTFWAVVRLPLPTPMMIWEEARRATD